MPETEIFSDSFPAFGGNCDLVFTGLNADEAKSILQRVKNEIEQLENIISPASMISDVFRLNNSNSGSWVSIDPIFTDVLSLCYDFYDMSNGAFDISAGSLYYLWEKTSNPEQDQINTATQTSGLAYLEFDAENHRVRFLKEGMKLDLRAIDKAYTADVIKNLLKEKRVTNCIISFDEEVILALGNHPTGQAWPIGVRNFEQPEQFLHIFESQDKCMVTSGTLKLDIESGRKAEKLIISPESGMPLEDVKTVSVSGASSTFAAFIAQIWLILPEHDKTLIAEQISDLEMFEAYYLADDIKTKLTLLKNEE